MPKNKMSETELANLKPYQKGVSGNPAGKIAGTKSRKILLREWLEIEDEFDNPLKAPDAPLERMSVADRVTLAIIRKAMNGDLAAFIEIQDTLYGKISNKVEIEQQSAQVLIYLPENNR